MGRVVLPGAIPGFLVGLRWAFGSAWLALIVAEELNTYSGLGYRIWQAQTVNRLDLIFLTFAIFASLGFLGDTVIRLLEHILLPWRRGYGDV